MCRTDLRLIFFVMWGAPPYKVGSVLVTLTYSEVKNKNLLFSLSNGQPRILIVPKIPSLYLSHFGEVGCGLTPCPKSGSFCVTFLTQKTLEYKLQCLPNLRILPPRVDNSVSYSCADHIKDKHLRLPDRGRRCEFLNWDALLPTFA